MRSSLTITSSSVSGIVMIVYPAFVVRRDVKASSIRALSSRNKTVHISASVLFFSVAPILSLSLSLSTFSLTFVRCIYRVSPSRLKKSRIRGVGQWWSANICYSCFDGREACGRHFKRFSFFCIWWMASLII